MMYALLILYVSHSRGASFCRQGENEAGDMYSMDTANREMIYIVYNSDHHHRRTPGKPVRTPT